MRAPTWFGRCVLGDGKDAKPLPSVRNALIALRNDPAIRDAFAFDEMLSRDDAHASDWRTARQ